jgi:hypothetical protein
MCVLHVVHLLAKGIAALFYNNDKMAMVFREWLRKQELYIYRDRIVKARQGLDNCINVTGDYASK